MVINDFGRWLLMIWDVGYKRVGTCVIHELGRLLSTSWDVGYEWVLGACVINEFGALVINGLGTLVMNDGTLV